MTKLRAKTTGSYDVVRNLPTDKESTENCARMERCPREEHCDAPKCPLDALYESRVYEEGDDVCLLEKPHRVRLFGEIETHGLFPAELRGILRSYGSWEGYVSSKTSSPPQDGS